MKTLSQMMQQKAVTKLCDTNFEVYRGAIDKILLDLAQMTADFDPDFGYVTEAENAFFALAQAQEGFNPEAYNHNAYLLKATTIEALHYTLQEIINADRESAHQRFEEFYFSSIMGWKPYTYESGYSLWEKYLGDGWKAEITKQNENVMPDMPTDKVTVMLTNINTGDEAEADFLCVKQASDYVYHQAPKIIQEFDEINQRIKREEINQNYISDAWKHYCQLEGIPYLSMDEVLALCSDKTTEKQRSTVKAFYDLWMELDS